jgi:tetratricopeptide (TPR) repeat protein
LVATVKFLIYFTVVATPFFYLAQGVYPYGLAKSLFFQAAVELLFFLWLALAILDKGYRPPKSPLLIALGVFLAVLTVTAAVGADPWRSFWSTQERAVGVVMFYHLAAFAVVVAGMRRTLRVIPLLAMSLVTAAGVSVIAFLQLRIPNLLLIEVIGSRPGATFGNPTFLAGYLALHIMLGIYLLAHFREGRSKAGMWFTLASLAVIAYALVLTETRGDFVGLAAGIVALCALWWRRPPALPSFFGHRAFYGWVCAALIAGGALFWVTRTSPLWESVPAASRFRSVSLDDPGLQPRFIALRAAWEGFKERLLTGWGWDNYNVAFNKFYDPRALEANYQETRFDKPHNFALEYLAVGGIPLAAAYVGVFAMFFAAAWRVRDRLLGSVVIAAGVAYITRNLFVFETIGPLMMWFLMIGFMIASEGRGEAGAPSPQVSRARIRALVAAAAVVALVPAYLLNILSMEASYYQYWGFQHFIRGRITHAIESFRRATSMWSPYTWNLKRDYAAAVAEAYFYNREKVPPEEALRAIRGMEEVVAAHPRDAYHHYALVDMYNQISDIAPETLLPKAEAAAAAALALSPNRQEVYFSLAKTKSLQGKNDEALAILEKTIELNPNIPDAHFYYGLIAFTLGDQEKGYAEVKRAIELGRKWKKYHEPRVVANLFADSGHLDEAIPLYETAIAMEPGDLEARAKLGIAHFLAGDKEKAKRYLTEVSRQFDFRNSPSYDSVKPILDELGIKLGN